jgi:hypothetical protein
MNATEKNHAMRRRNRILALALATVAVLFYVGIALRWGGGR